MEIKNIEIEDMGLIFVDTETTGLDRDHDDIHEISMVCGNKSLTVYVIPDSINESDKWTSPFLKDGKLPDEKGRIEWKKAYKIIKDWIKERQKTYADLIGEPDARLKWFGQNTQFDFEFMMNHGKLREINNTYFDYKFLDLYSMAYLARKLGKYPNNKRLKLETMAEHFGLNQFGEAHNSLTDALVTRELYYKFLELLNE
jgi:DNA polymerase III epsilon subunit-like protein